MNDSFLPTIFVFTGSVVGPVVFGAVTDSSCLIWQTECGEKTSCWIYDNDSVRRNYFIIAIVLKFFSVLSFFLAFILYKPPKTSGNGKQTANIELGSTFTNVGFVSDRL